MPQTVKNMPTLIDWYLTDLAGKPIDHESVLRAIKKHGRLDYPAHQFSVVGKLYHEGDDEKIAPACYANTLSIQCIGSGNFKIVSNCYRELIIHRDNMLKSDQIDEIKLELQKA